jgi:hypothetical protein
MAVTPIADVTNYDLARFIAVPPAKKEGGAKSDEGWIWRGTGIADTTEMKSPLIDLRGFKNAGFALEITLSNLDASAHTTTGYDVYIGKPVGGQPAISAITAAAAGQVTMTGHTLSDDDFVLLSGIVGTPVDNISALENRLNGKIFRVDDDAANTWTLADAYGNDIATTNDDAYVSGGTAQLIMETSCKAGIDWLTSTNPEALATRTQAVGRWNQDTIPSFFRVSMSGHASETDIEIAVEMVRLLPTVPGARKGL